MFRRATIALFAAGLLLPVPACAQRPATATPTTRILAIGTGTSGADPEQVKRILPSEVLATTELYLEGRIDQWYSLQSKPGVVLILNESDPAAARQVLATLPLGRAHLMTFELLPIGPLAPLRQLMAGPQSK